ncbi:MAG: hypothetical protein AB7F66_02215 [Bacteriovoracia bacterium]
MSASAQADSPTCRSPYAVVVQGALPSVKAARNGFENTIDELMKDFRDRGYTVLFFQEPTFDTLAEQLQDPCVKVFGFVGEGIEEDSKTYNLNDANGADLIFLSESEVIDAAMMKAVLKGRPPLELVIMHACYQGAKYNRVRWRQAFRILDEKFLSWHGLARFNTTYWWQFFWK